jgi:hypothetical protein
VLGLEVDAAVLSGAPAVVFKHALKNVPDVAFACTLHEAAVRVMGSAANTLERLMEQEYANNMYLREYLIRLRVQLVLEAHCASSVNEADDGGNNAILATCSSAFAACLDSLQQLKGSDGADNCDFIASIALRSTLRAVSNFLAANAQPGSLQTEEGHIGKK